MTGEGSDVIVDVVGCGDAFGSGGRLQTCFALRADADAPPRTLIDCGATSLTGLRRAGIDPAEVRTVVLSHLHGDHFGGLPFLVLDVQFRRRAADLTVTGPPGRSSSPTSHPPLSPSARTSPRPPSTTGCG